MQRQIPNKYHRWRKKESRSTWKGHINAKIPSMGKWKEWISHSTMPPSESLLSVGKKKTNNQVNRFLFLEQSLLQSVVTYTRTTWFRKNTEDKWKYVNDGNLVMRNHEVIMKSGDRAGLTLTRLDTFFFWFYFCCQQCNKFLPLGHCCILPAQLFNYTNASMHWSGWKITSFKKSTLDAEAPHSGSQPSGTTSRPAHERRQLKDRHGWLNTAIQALS